MCRSFRCQIHPPAGKWNSRQKPHKRPKMVQRALGKPLPQDRVRLVRLLHRDEMAALLDHDQLTAFDGGCDLLRHEERRGGVVAAADHDGQAGDLGRVGPAVDADRGQLLLALVDLDAGLGAHRHHRVDQRLVGQAVGRNEARHLQAEHELEMALLGEPDAGAADRLLGRVLRAHAGVEQRQPAHPPGRDLHDLDRDHAAQRQAGQGEPFRRHLAEHPARGLLPAVEDRQRRLAPVRHHDVRNVFQRGDLRREQPRRAQQARDQQQRCLGHGSSPVKRSVGRAPAIPMLRMNEAAPVPPYLAPGRDLRLDFFRGLALWFIYLDHIPDNLVSWLTVRNYGFSDATEMFVFISGYTAVIAYSRMLLKEGWPRAAARIFRRVWQLYVAHILLFVAFIAQIAYVSIARDTPQLIEEMQLLGLGQNPYQAILEAALLKFRPVNLDVLPLYIVLLAAFPFALPALMRWPWAVILVSIGLYGVTSHFNWNLPGYPDDKVWFFNPMAWQVIFYSGAVLAVVASTLTAFDRWRHTVTVLALLYLLF